YRHQLAEKATLDSELSGDRAFGVRKQRVVEVLLVGEFGLLLHRVGADSHSAGPDCGELLSQVAKVAGFLGATRRHRGRIEEQHDRSVGKQRAELARRACLVWELEVGHSV